MFEAWRAKVAEQLFKCKYASILMRVSDCRKNCEMSLVRKHLRGHCLAERKRCVALNGHGDGDQCGVEA